jgi:predicted Fe-Mo cluster-binding NifX family protein
MIIALPVANGTLCMHFGHCEMFALITVDTDAKRIIERSDIVSPPHQPGLLPQWLHEHGVNVVISGGMGERARAIFESHNIQVVIGARLDDPQRIVEDYLAGTLCTGENICDH